MSAKVVREIFFYFTYPIDVNVTLHTNKLKMAVEYEIVIIIAVNKVYTIQFCWTFSYIEQVSKCYIIIK